ncbi:hypothetical protein BGZ58_008501 [Dissophora ornata]|nr:hypothetical protein BGZ58_008501 [Dissophora ornata]
MAFGGYNPVGSQEPPFSTSGGIPATSTTTMRSRTGSVSSVHSNHSHQGYGSPSVPPPPQQQQQQQQQNPYQSPYLSQPGTPRGGASSHGAGPDSGYFQNNSTLSNNNSNARPSGVYGSTEYSSYGPQQHHPMPTHNRRNGTPVNGTNGGATDEGGYSSGYDSPTGISSSVPYSLNYNYNTGFNPQQQQQQQYSQYQPDNDQQQQRRYSHRSHSRKHSNASETSLNIDTTVAGHYSPGPASLSSASSSRRGSISEPGGIINGSTGLASASSMGGFFSRKNTFRPTTAAATSSDADDDLDLDLGNKSPRRLRQKKTTKRSSSKGAGWGISGSSRMSRVSGILNDWDLLLPSGDPYENDDDDEDDGMTENERWKKRQLTKRGWESARGQWIILAVLVTIAVFVRIWKLAVPSAVVFDEQHFGRFTLDYLKGNFFMDVHPPLGKMLFSLVAYLLSFDGKFEFALGSIKWVGFFTVTTVGLCALKYLQESRAHLYISTRDFSKQFFSLFLGLSVLPFVLYVGLYAIDFSLLPNSGHGNSWVSPQFRMTLKGHDVQPVMTDIAWQSKIHLRHAAVNGGWVHSMPGEYAREGTVDQAIQLVEWDDDLTCWQVHAADPIVEKEQAQKYFAREKMPSLPFEGYIYDGDTIRLRHCHSKVVLSVENLESIGSNKSYIRETRGVQWSEDSTAETTWRVELVPQGTLPGLDDYYGLKLDSPSVNGAIKEDPAKVGKNSATADSKDPSKRWHSIEGFRLYNEKLDCYLLSHKVFRARYSSHQEVGCIQGNRQKSDTLFVVDQNMNPHLPKSSPSLSYQPLPFFQKFLELNRVMWWTHHDLSSPIHTDNYYYSGVTKKKREESHPLTWPFLNRGLNYYSSKETNNYVYLMGNPLLWWAASATAFGYMFRCLLSMIWRLRANSMSETKSVRDRFAYGADFSSRAKCETARSLGGWEFVCQRQNLPLARPQEATAKIVVEKRSDYEQHKEKEEEEESKLYYQVSSTAQYEGDVDNHIEFIVDDDHGKDRGEDHEHDHEGPFNEDERGHYDHEHFHHPHGHGHENQDPVSENGGHPSFSLRDKLLKQSTRNFKSYFKHTMKNLSDSDNSKSKRGNSGNSAISKNAKKMSASGVSVKGKNNLNAKHENRRGVKTGSDKNERLRSDVNTKHASKKGVKNENRKSVKLKNDKNAKNRREENSNTTQNCNAKNRNGESARNKSKENVKPKNSVNVKPSYNNSVNAKPSYNVNAKHKSNKSESSKNSVNVNENEKHKNSVNVKPSYNVSEKHESNKSESPKKNVNARHKKNLRVNIKNNEIAMRRKNYYVIERKAKNTQSSGAKLSRIRNKRPILEK